MLAFVLIFIRFEKAEIVHLQKAYKIKSSKVKLS